MIVNKYLEKIDDALLTLRGIIKYNRLFSKSQYFTDNEVKSYQEKQLKLILQHCGQKIPYYSRLFKNYGINPLSNEPFVELNKIPILTKDSLKENYPDLIRAGAANSGLVLRTSGSTGEPLITYTSREQWEVEQGIIWRSWKWAGYKFRDKIAIFRSYSPEQNQRRFYIDRIKNWAYFSVFHLSDEDLKNYLDFLSRWKPIFLRGYPSSLKVVADYALKNKIKLPTLKGAFTASEVLEEDTRESLRKAFNIETFDHYGQAEISCMFHECEEHSGLHVDWEYGFVELLPSEQETKYRIIATNLHNTEMPLLRYDTGDLSDGKFRKCNCGRQSYVINKIEGRNDGYIFKEDGSKMSTVNLYTYFSKLSDIEKFQIIHNKKGKLSIIIKVGVKKNPINIQEKIIEELEKKSGLSIEVEVGNFHLTDQGKFLTFKNDLPNES